MTEEVLQLERDLALLVDEGYLDSELAELQKEDPNEIIAVTAGKRPASVSFTQRPGLGRNGRIENHFRGAASPEACPE
jgi:hypothetical protein